MTSEIAESGGEGSGAKHGVLFGWPTRWSFIWFCGAVIITAGVGGVFRQSAGDDEPDGVSMRSVRCCTARRYCNLDDVSFGIKDVKSSGLCQREGTTT